MVAVATDKSGFNSTTDPVHSDGMMLFANDVDGLFNDILNGASPDGAFDQQLFSSAESVSILSGVMAVGGAAYSPQKTLVSVTSETGSSDTLTTIPVSNNRRVVLKAAAGHTITIDGSGGGNITTIDGGNIALSGNGIVELWCLGSQWAVIGASGSGVNPVLNNYAGVVDPTPSEDSNDGYAVGSTWVNIVNDRAFMLTDSATGNSLWKRLTPPKNRWAIRAAAAVATGVGIASPTVANSPSATNDATNTFVTMPSTASGGNLAGLITTTFDLVRPSHEFTAEWIIKTGSLITSVRIWIGFVDAAITDVDTLAAGREFIGFRFSSVVPDVGWQPVLHDGTTQNANAAEIGTVAIDTVYKLRVRVVGTTAYFSVDDSAEVAVTTNFPSVSQDLGMVMRVIPQAASIRNLLLSSAEVVWG